MASNVERDLVDADMLSIHVLIVSEPGQIVRNEGLHDEQSIIVEMVGDVLEAPHLVLLSQEVEQRVEHDEDQPVGSGHWHLSEVSHRDRELLASRLGPELGDHCRRKVDAVDPDPACGQRKCDASRANRELEGGTSPSELTQERNGRLLIAPWLVVIYVRR